MSRYIRLLEYLKSAKEGGFGWVPEYNKHIAGDDRSYLCGHYRGLVDDIVDVVGLDRLLSLACIMSDISEKSESLRDVGRLSHQYKNESERRGEMLKSCLGWVERFVFHPEQGEAAIALAKRIREEVVQCPKDKHGKIQG